VRQLPMITLILKSEALASGNLFHLVDIGPGGEEAMIERFIIEQQRPSFVLTRQTSHAEVKIELSDAEYHDYRAMMDAYVRWQNKLSVIYEAHPN
jgi:hypothetical protein